MSWKINFIKSASKEYLKLSKEVRLLIQEYLQKKVIISPRDYGKALVTSGTIKLWRYRIRHFRIICQIQDNELTILVISIGKRDNIYKNLKN